MASASVAAAIAIWVNRSARRTSFAFSKNGVGSNAVMRLEASPGSLVMRPFQNASTPMPQWATTPRPVMATRRG